MPHLPSSIPGVTSTEQSSSQKTWRFQMHSPGWHNFLCSTGEELAAHIAVSCPCNIIFIVPNSVKEQHQISSAPRRRSKCKQPAPQNSSTSHFQGLGDIKEEENEGIKSESEEEPLEKKYKCPSATCDFRHVAPWDIEKHWAVSRKFLSSHLLFH
jgi:hypothetical protein